MKQKSSQHNAIYMHCVPDRPALQKQSFEKRRYFRQIVIRWSMDSYPALDPEFGDRDLIT